MRLRMIVEAAMMKFHFSLRGISAYLAEKYVSEQVPRESAMVDPNPYRSWTVTVIMRPTAATKAMQ